MESHHKAQKEYRQRTKEIKIPLKREIYEQIASFCANQKKPFATYARVALFEKLEKDGFFDDFPELKVRKK